mmetsp:Transcript_1364/g.3031  ORF Transcript_1364/g.3031 Transcript_1364/m.3031 type:complete len:188 (+) Transcript_1364:320-883(+)|eukprot:CAMPEP_0113453920 /NCGR_PEP_ID=MMETSP0014_2-20120614/7601_1 /TAXON_ID=2857 /ORGANISM="Nitzschia sp." /LENGTH=187 /DNA_ID=CAMNT_0000345319 /DNA_START=320 /DNA_END=883 /DNA_ORIENTATION=+ /assembly_acc=CAM_ASM_000159
MDYYYNFDSDHNHHTNNYNYSHHNQSSISMPQHYGQEQQQQNEGAGAGELSSSSSSDFVDSVVRTSKVASSMLLEYCSLCTVYIDQQVQYELFAPNSTSASIGSGVSTKNRPQRSDTRVFWDVVQGGLVAPTSTGAAAAKNNTSMDSSYCSTDDDSMMSEGLRRVSDLSKQLDMFDEDSVVESVELR